MKQNSPCTKNLMFSHKCVNYGPKLLAGQALCAGGLGRRIE